MLYGLGFLLYVLYIKIYLILVINFLGIILFLINRWINWGFVRIKEFV